MTGGGGALLIELPPQQLHSHHATVCEGGLSGLMSIQRTAIFQTCGIKPSQFSDMVKARAKTL